MAEPEVTKSELKRQALLLQNIGLRLAGLKVQQLARIPLSSELQHAIADYQRFPSREAKRRQLQFIGKLMRQIDTEPILAVLDELDGTSAAARYQIHQLEQWRDRLLAEPAALTEYFAEHPTVDRQRLKHQLQKVRKARDENQQRLAARELFRLLREFG
jgi:ribosome-associated protein